MSAALVVACCSLVLSGCLPQTAPYAGHPSDAHWDAIAKCEEGGDWTAHGYGNNGDGVYYTGGVAFALSTWLSFGGDEFASEAALASRAQQIIVANRVWAANGDSAWGCKSDVP